MSSEDIVKLERTDGSSCQIHIFGATLTSWICQGEERIFVSSKAIYNKQKAIRGGIPVVFPNFGPWELGPQHGFARITAWQVAQQQKDSAGNPSVTFTLTDSEHTRKMWNYKFVLSYKVTLGETCLTTDLTVDNTDNQPFDFTCLLHTYLKVPECSKCSISGLEGLQYRDKLRGGEEFTEDRDLVAVTDNVDRVYVATPSCHTVTDTPGGSMVTLHKTNLPDTVVWNPWTTAVGMSDMADNEYPGMLCVEAGYVASRKVLAPGGRFETSQTLSISKL